MSTPYDWRIDEIQRQAEQAVRDSRHLTEKVRRLEQQVDAQQCEATSLRDDLNRALDRIATLEQEVIDIREPLR